MDTSVKFSKEAADRAQEIKKLHETVRSRIEQVNAKVKKRVDQHRRFIQFKPGDLVWLHFRKEWFPMKRRLKLSPRSDGPFKVLERVNDNAYKVGLPGEFSVHGTFNVSDLWSYYEDDEGIPSLRTHFSQAGEDDNDPGPTDTSTATDDPGPTAKNLFVNWVALLM
ncbi:putative nucleotidyltransferase, Ribonuclease H [Helianthus annuus]|nr:putative nucleotidyltransferase, Ribonuclease H [Helianthus annuus]